VEDNEAAHEDAEADQRGVEVAFGHFELGQLDPVEESLEDDWEGHFEDVGQYVEVGCLPDCFLGVVDEPFEEFALEFFWVGVEEFFEVVEIGVEDFFFAFEEVFEIVVFFVAGDDDFG
jgi:hypothetical protein